MALSWFCIFIDCHLTSPTLNSVCDNSPPAMSTSFPNHPFKPSPLSGTSVVSLVLYFCFVILHRFSLSDPLICSKKCKKDFDMQSLRHNILSFGSRWMSLYSSLSLTIIIIIIIIIIKLGTFALALGSINEEVYLIRRFGSDRSPHQ